MSNTAVIIFLLVARAQETNFPLFGSEFSKEWKEKSRFLVTNQKTLSQLSYGKSNSHVGQLTEQTGRLKNQAWKWARLGSQGEGHSTGATGEHAAILQDPL